MSHSETRVRTVELFEPGEPANSSLSLSTLLQYLWGMMHDACLLFFMVMAACTASPNALDPNKAEVAEAAQPGAETDVRPGINEKFLDPSMDVQEWVQRFEGESREIFASRTRIARACEFSDAMDIADVGAGTGLFTFLFAQDVGSDGTVFAVDIAPTMLEHIREKAAQRGMTQVQPVLGTVRECNLPESSVDAVFACDTYHHFNYPMTTLASLRTALRPGGTLIVVDFERIEGVSREWTMGHVRAGKEVFRREIENAGFTFVEEVTIEGLEENYFLRFRAP